MNKTTTMLAAASLVLAPAAYGDLVVLDNGDRLTGTITRMQEDSLTLETAYAGEVNIGWQAVAALETDEPVEVMLTDGTLLRSRIARAGDGSVVLEAGETLPSASVALGRIAALNPSPEISGRGTRVRGRVDIGAAVATGNTETENLHLDAELVARTRENRYTIGARMLKSAEDGRDTADSTLVYSKYDHFLSERRYLYANVSFERDAFKDLNLRSALGAGAGHQFVESRRRNLSLEGGLTYVNEDFETIADDSYMAARWALDYDQRLLQERIQVFHRHEGLVSVEDTDDVILRSQTGVRFPWTDNLNTSLQLNLDWDRSPPPGTENTDLTYLLNVGYNW